MNTFVMVNITPILPLHYPYTPNIYPKLIWYVEMKLLKIVNKKKY